MTGVAAGRRTCVIEEVMLDDRDIGNIAAIGPLGGPPHSKYERLIARAKQVPAATTIVVHPCEETALRGPIEAAQAGIIVPILVGPAAKIAAVAREHRLDIDRFEIVDVPHSDAAAAKAVELIHQSKGELLMKGSLHTDELMREVTSSKTGLRTARRISHVFILDVPTYSETLGRRDSDSQDPFDHRRGRALQDGRTWTDNGWHSRWAACFRQCDRSRSGADQGH